MPTPRRLGFSDALLFLIILVAAGGARTWYLIVCANSGISAGPLRVQDAQPVLTSLPADSELHGREQPTEQDALIHNLKEHRWFGSLAPFATGEEKTAHVAPGYPWLLAWLELSPLQLGPPDWTVRWMQCCLGTLTAVLYFFFALRAFESRWVATLTGAGCALNPFWIINTAQVDDGVLTTFLLAACIASGARAGRAGGAGAGLLYGVGLAGLALVRATLLPFAIVALAWLLFRCRGLRRGWLCALLAFLGFANTLTLWTVRNYMLFHSLVPIADSTFYHVWIGNNPRATGGPLLADSALDALAEARGQDRDRVAIELGELDQNERYQQLARDVVAQVRQDPAGFFKHRIESGLCFLFGEEWLKSRALWQRTDSEAVEMPVWLADSYPAILTGFLLCVLLLGMLGWRWSYGWRFAAMPSSLAVVWIALPYLLSHAEMLSGPRLPLDGVFICYAAFAVACLTSPFAVQGAGGRKDSEERVRGQMGA
jgi:hypothetical protein